MAASLGSDTDELVENSDINVTPFIDVMLVLLIIFMVAAPLSTVDVPVELPVSTAKPQPRPDKPVMLTLKADLTVAVGERMVSFAELGSAIDMETRLDREQRIFLRADQAVPYGELVHLMNALRANGYLKIALVGLEDTGSQPAVAPSPSSQPSSPVPSP